MNNQDYFDEFSSDEEDECPLCMEPLAEDDKNFYPCSCRYQVCRFCWHRIRSEENGLCPACRAEYSEKPYSYEALSVEEMAKLKAEKKQKKAQKRQKDVEMRRHLSNVRVVQKNLVYVIGLPHRVVNNEALLRRNDFFGKYGKIHKVVINKNNHYNSGANPTVSAYITFARKEDASHCVRATDKSTVDGRVLRASLGTTKYCSNFLRNQSCPNPDCMYLHELGDEAQSFSKQDMLEGKHAPNVTVEDAAAQRALAMAAQMAQQQRLDDGLSPTSEDNVTAAMPIPIPQSLAAGPKPGEPGPQGSWGSSPAPQGSWGASGPGAGPDPTPTAPGNGTAMSTATFTTITGATGQGKQQFGGQPPLPAPVPLGQAKQTPPPHAQAAPTLQLQQQQQQQKQSRKGRGRNNPDMAGSSATSDATGQSYPPGPAGLGVFPPPQPQTTAAPATAVPNAGLLPDPLFPTLQTSAMPVSAAGAMPGLPVGPPGPQNPGLIPGLGGASGGMFDWQTPAPLGLSGQDLLARLQSSALGLPPPSGGPGSAAKEETDIDFDPWAEMSRGLAQDLFSETNQLVTEAAQSLQMPPPTLMAATLSGPGAQLALAGGAPRSQALGVAGGLPVDFGAPRQTTSRFAFARPSSEPEPGPGPPAPAGDGSMPAQFQQQMRSLFPGVNINFAPSSGPPGKDPKTGGAPASMPAQPGMTGAGQKPMGIGPPRAGGGRGRGYAGARGRGALGRGGHRGGGMAGRRPISQQQPIAPGAMPQADRFYMPPRAADGTAAAVPTGAAIGPLIMAGPPGGAPASLAQRSKSAAAAASGPFGGYGGNPPPTAGLQNMRIASGPDPRAKQGQPTGRGNGQPSQGGKWNKA